MNFTALVADDDPLMRGLIRLALTAAGITRILEASTGTEALRLFHEHPCDLLLIDWYMPGQNGLEILRAVRAAGSLVPVIMVTAEAERDQVLAAIEAGATDYLLKPFEPQLLWRKLNKYVQRHSPIAH